MGAGTQCDEHGGSAETAADPEANLDGQQSLAPDPGTTRPGAGAGAAAAAAAPGAPAETTTTTAPATTGTASAATATASSPALLHNILSRVRMLGRARAPRASGGKTTTTSDHVLPPTATATPGPEAPPTPARSPKRIASDAVATASAAATPPAARHRRGASAGLGLGPAAESASYSVTRGARPGAGAATAEASDSDSVLSTASSGYTFFDPTESGQINLKAKDLGPFCEQLDRLLDYIHSTRDLNHLMYTYPSKLQDLLDAKANELHTIYLEARAARIRIQQVKNQRKAVRKDYKTAEKTLNLLKEEEIKEMENYIALYDKTLMSHWEKIRSSAQEDIVDSFIQDIKGKQKALEYLHTLSTNKLHKLKKNTTQSGAAEEVKPVSLALRRLSANSGARSTGRWRSKHHERALRGPLSTAQSVDTTITMPLVPLAAAPFSFTLGSTFSATENNAGSSRVSTLTTSGSVSSSLLANNGLTTLHNLTTSPPSNIRERQAALRALFSDIQNLGTNDNLPINAVMPHFITATSLTARARVGGNIETQNREANGSRNTANDNTIELYTLHDPT